MSQVNWIEVILHYTDLTSKATSKKAKRQQGNKQQGNKATLHYIQCNQKREQ